MGKDRLSKEDEKRFIELALNHFAILFEGRLPMQLP